MKLHIHSIGRAQFPLCSYFPPPPPYWERITLPAGILSPLQKRDWQLVLNARGIPYRIARARGREHIFTPAFLAGMAKYELSAYNRENRKSYSHSTPHKLHADWPFAPLLLIFPALFYALQKGLLPILQWLPENWQWLEAGRLDSMQVSFHQQWWRLATALDLHADPGHLAGNLFFGAVFLALLARLCGVGWSWLITVIGGVLGNGLSVLIHTYNYNSVGFSTAAFAALGGIAGIMIMGQAKNALLPAGGAMALLALLGAEGTHTDYGAHISGLICGCMAGMFYRWGKTFIPQWLGGLCAVGILSAAWLCAIRAFCV